MWKVISSASRNGIIAKSVKGTHDRVNGQFDLGIFFGSYESRSLVSAELLRKNSCQNAIVILFEETDNLGLRKLNDQILFDNVKNCSCSKPKIIRGSVRNIRLILKEILRHIPRSSIFSKSNIFIDISGAPKPYFLGILSNLRKRVNSPKVTLFHPTGDYESVSGVSKGFSFTTGFDKYLWVPGYPGRPDPRKSWSFLFLLGFEGERSYGTYYRFEPQHVMALIGRPGYKKRYTSDAENRNAAFLEEAEPAPIIYANAADPVQTWEVVEDAISKIKQQYNVCLVPLGPKPHALGGALAALSDNAISILYLMPREWTFRDVKRGKYVWIYEMEL